jgi:hypothetical protein
VKNVRTWWVVGVTAAAWVGISVLALAIAGDTLPFDRPSLAGRGVPGQVLDGSLNLLAALLLVGIAYGLTRRRRPPDLAARSPRRRRAAIELAALIGYVGAAMAGGYGLGHALGDHPFGLHLPGSLYGISNPPDASWVAAWAVYNAVVYALVPYLVFRNLGYSPERLNLTSTNRRSDLRLILVILVVESVLEFATLGGPLLGLSGADALRSVPTSFLVNFVGTVLPIAVLIYGIALPRVLRLTGSVAATAVLGGLAYALIHIFDGWATYASAREAVLTLVFLVLQYFGPGLIKSVLTLRTGNVWVHVWGYHAIAPHATVDAPVVTHLFH